jgi:hypothetical protein
MVNGSASHVLVRPMIVMAARVLGPGPTRLRLVKLAHNLSSESVAELPSGDFASGEGPTSEPRRRAA